MEPCVPLPLEPEELKDLVDKAKDWAVMHGHLQTLLMQIANLFDRDRIKLFKLHFLITGAGMRSRDNFSTDSINFAPFLLLPSTFPRTEFERSVRIQPVLNELIHKVAHDYKFLKNCLEKYGHQ